MVATRTCAMVMLESGTYIRKELANVQMDAALKSEAESVCDDYIATKHDVIHELHELDDLVRDHCAPDIVEKRMNRIVEWLTDTVRKAHPLVKALEVNSELPKVDEGGGYLLVAESAANVLTAMLDVQQKQDVYAAATRERPRNFVARRNPPA
jgi:hypothetical protein